MPSLEYRNGTGINGRIFPGELTFAIAADGNTAKVGLVDNLIVDISADPPKNPQGDKKRPQQQRVYIGTLPAITCEIVQRGDCETRPKENN